MTHTQLLEISSRRLMSMSSKSLRNLRIIAVPLTRPKLPLRRDALAALTYYQFQIGYPQHPVSQNSSENGSASRWVPEGGYIKWITTKAADTWAGFGKAKGGWKVCFSQQRLLRLVLLGLPPAQSVPGWRTARRPFGF